MNLLYKGATDEAVRSVPVPYQQSGSDDAPCRQDQARNGAVCAEGVPRAHQNQTQEWLDPLLVTFYMQANLACFLFLGH